MLIYHFVSNIAVCVNLILQDVLFLNCWSTCSILQRSASHVPRYFSCELMFPWVNKLLCLILNTRRRGQYSCLCLCAFPSDSGWGGGWTLGQSNSSSKIPHLPTYWGTALVHSLLTLGLGRAEKKASMPGGYFLPLSSALTQWFWTLAMHRNHLGVLKVLTPVLNPQSLIMSPR